jgi:hypothetical protein
MKEIVDENIPDNSNIVIINGIRYSIDLQYIIDQLTEIKARLDKIDG